MLRSAECSAVPKHALLAEPITVTAITPARVTWPGCRTIRPSARYAVSRTPSQTSMSRRRSVRSTSTPAGSRPSTITASPIVPTRPAIAGECPADKINRGTASVAIAFPRSDRHWLTHRTLNSRLRHRFAGAWVMPSTLAAPTRTVKLRMRSATVIGVDLQGAISDERRRLADLLDTLTPGQLDAPSLCGDWTVKQVAGHLLAAFTTPRGAMLRLVVRNGFRLHRANAQLAVRCAERHTAGELAGSLRRHADHVFDPPVVGLPGQLTDLQVHGQDMRRPLSLPHGLRTERLRVSLDFLTGGRAPGFTPRKRPAGLRFESTDLDWAWGSGPVLAGPAEALMMALTGRSVVLGELDGPGVAVLRGRLGRVMA